MVMDPHDVALLYVLGTAEATPTAFADLCTTARYVVPNDWQPTSEVIRAATERALRDGLLVLLTEAESGHEVLETTAPGQAAIVALLRKPVPGGGDGFARTCMTVKLSFLHLLPLSLRDEEIASLQALYRRAVDVVRRLQLGREVLATPAASALRSEQVRLESELAWLEAMERWQPVARAAE